VNEDYAELIGIILGDGHLDNCQNHYRIGITGDKVTDQEYFEYIKQLIKRVWNKDVTVAQRPGCIRIIVNSKPVFTELTKKYDMPVGEGKSYRVHIHELITRDWKLARRAIRGLVDTDGTIFTADKRGAPNYPSIEITTASLRLAHQLKQLLSAQGFRVANIWEDKPRNNAGPTYRVPLNGYENVRLWLQEIGFSNPVKHRKAEHILATQILFNTARENKLSEKEIRDFSVALGKKITGRK
jgi:hypothetical protein